MGKPSKTFGDIVYEWGLLIVMALLVVAAVGTSLGYRMDWLATIGAWWLALTLLMGVVVLVLLVFGFFNRRKS